MPIAVRSLLASLGLLAAIVHLAMVPSHWGEWRAEGIAFAVAGWVQLALAVACAWAPTRRVLLATALVALASVGAWAVTRTSGSPWGPHSWHAEAVTAVDLTVVVAESLLFLLAAAVLLGATWSTAPGAGRRVALLAPLLAMIATTAVLASPGARNHAHGAHGGHAHGDGPAVASTEPHAHDVAVAGPATPHDHVEPAGDDKGLSLLTNGHQHAAGEVELDLQTRLRLDAQLVATLDLVAKYPTVAEAEAAGFRRAGPFSPGLGTHFTPPSFSFNADGRMDPEDMAWPTLIYDGWDATAPIAGFMYQTYTPDGVEPEGFAGPNDHWHYHTNVCIVMGPDGIETPLGADRSATQEQCSEFGGMLIPRTGYMVHVWTVPGYESERGIFSEVNPAITCPDGTYFTRPGEEIGAALTTCRP
jgi:hypothetical protein